MASRFTAKEMKKLLENSRIGIENILKNPEVIEKVKVFGITLESLPVAQELLKKAEDLYMKKGPKTGQKISLSIQVKERINNLNDTFMVYEKMIRTDLRKDPALFSEFSLKGKRDTSFTGKIKEPKIFYQNCLDNEKLGNFVVKHGLSQEEIKSRLAEIAEVEKELEKRAKFIQESELTTQERNDTMVELNNWWLNFKRALVHVFDKEPQRLEEFGIKAYSEGYNPFKPKKNGTPGGDGNKSGSGKGKDQGKGTGAGSRGKVKPADDPVMNITTG